MDKNTWGGSRSGSGRKKTGIQKPQVYFNLSPPVIDWITNKAKKAGKPKSTWLNGFLHNHMTKERNMEMSEFVQNCIAQAKTTPASAIEEIATPEDLIAYAIFRSKPTEDGHASLGEALASCATDLDASGKNEITFTRISKSQDLASLLQALQKTLPFIATYAHSRISYVRLFDDLRQFAKADGDAEEMAKIKRRWTQDFYSYER